MDKIVVEGGVPLYGEILISGAKNSVLALMPAALLTKDDVSILNVPQLSDVTTMSNLLLNHGSTINVNDAGGYRALTINSSNISNYQAPYDIVRKMRASILVLGPLLARFGIATVSFPGGCALGPRPINLHLEAFKSMGADIQIKDGYLEATAKKGLKGAEIFLEVASVGATENIMMAATLADGITEINNAAKEPEISDLADMLNKMGADIKGAGTEKITIKGVATLSGVCHKVIPDRIEAITYAIAAAITGGELILKDSGYDIYKIIHNMADKLINIGISIDNQLDNIIVRGHGKVIKPLDIVTGFYPLFPSDAQAQFMSLLCLASGTSVIQETLYENRLTHVPELNRMGANISVKGNTAHINGIKKFYGAEVMATDLRASVSLVLAGLAAEGKTTINRVYHLDRGYEKIEEKLGRCGARITRVHA